MEVLHSSSPQKLALAALRTFENVVSWFVREKCGVQLTGDAGFWMNSDVRFSFCSAVFSVRLFVQALMSFAALWGEQKKRTQLRNFVSSLPPLENSASSYFCFGLFALFLL